MDANKIYDGVMKAVDERMANAPHKKCNEHLYFLKSVDEFRDSFTVMNKRFEDMLEWIHDLMIKTKEDSSKQFKKLNDTVIRIEEREKSFNLFWGGVLGLAITLIFILFQEFLKTGGTP